MQIQFCSCNREIIKRSYGGYIILRQDAGELHDMSEIKTNFVSIRSIKRTLLNENREINNRLDVFN